MKKEVNTLNKMIENNILKITDYVSMVFNKDTINLRTFKSPSDIYLKREILDIKVSKEGFTKFVWFHANGVRVQITFIGGV